MKRAIGYAIAYIGVAGAPMFAMGYYINGWMGALTFSAVIPFAACFGALTMWLLDDQC